MSRFPAVFLWHYAEDAPHQLRASKIGSRLKAPVGISFEFKRQKIDGMTVKTLQTPSKSRRYGLTERGEVRRVSLLVTLDHLSLSVV